MIERNCCPECEAVQIDRRVNGGFAPAPSDDKEYRCRKCEATFNEPSSREIEPQPPRQEPARTLYLEGLNESE